MNNNVKNDVARQVVEEYIKNSEERYQNSLVKDGEKSSNDKVVGDYGGVPITVTYPGDVKTAEALARLAQFRLLDDSETGYDTWTKIQEYLEGRNNETVDRDIKIEYSYKLASKRAASLANYNDDGYKQSVAYPVNDEVSGNKAAQGRNVSNYSRKIQVNHEGTAVRVTDQGTNPYTHKRVRPSFRRVKLWEDAPALIDADELYQHKVYYRANKKADGRSIREGLVTIHDEEPSNRHNQHWVLCVNKPRVLYSPTNRTETRNGVTRQVYKVTKLAPCDCGCNVSSYDEKHGITFCPRCGLLQ